MCHTCMHNRGNSPTLCWCALFGEVPVSDRCMFYNWSGLDKEKG